MANFWGWYEELDVGVAASPPRATVTLLDDARGVLQRACEQRVREEREKMSKELSELAMIKRKLKKEEENRRIFGEVAKKREEELKKLQAEYQQLLNDGKTTDERERKDRIVAM